MKLCPNCNKPFEEKAGRFFCEEHGWHGLNEAGEIIPGDEPTPEELGAWIIEQNKQQPADPAAQDEPEPAEPGAPIGAELPAVKISEKTLYLCAAVIGVMIIAYGLYGMYKRRKEQQ